MHFLGQLDDHVRQRIANFFRVADNHAFAVTQHDVTGDADDGGVCRYAPEYDRASPDSAVVTYSDVPEDFCSGANRHTVADCGMSLSFLFARPAQSDALVESYIITNDGRFTNYDRHPVIDEQTPSNLGPGMDLNASEQAGHLRSEASGKTKPVSPQPACSMMHPDCVQSGIAEQHFEIRTGCRVGLENRGYVFAHSLEKADHGSETVGSPNACWRSCSNSTLLR